MSEQAIGLILQAGFAGVLLAYVLVVNKQFTTLVNALDRHLERLTSLLGDCVGDGQTTPRN